MTKQTVEVLNKKMINVVKPFIILGVLRRSV